MINLRKTLIDSHDIDFLADGSQKNIQEYPYIKMKTQAAKPLTVAEYIRAAPKESQKKLKEIRKCIAAAAPKAKQSLSGEFLLFLTIEFLSCTRVFASISDLFHTQCHSGFQKRSCQI